MWAIMHVRSIWLTQNPTRDQSLIDAGMNLDMIKQISSYGMAFEKYPALYFDPLPY